MSTLALVTGASSGIGKAFVQRLAAGPSTDEGQAAGYTAGLGLPKILFESVQVNGGWAGR